MKRQKKDVWTHTERRKVKGCIIQRKKKVNEQFGRKTNENANGNRKWFWKEESCSRIKEGNGRLAQGGDEM